MNNSTNENLLHLARRSLLCMALLTGLGPVIWALDFQRKPVKTGLWIYGYLQVVRGVEASPQTKERRLLCHRSLVCHPLQAPESLEKQRVRRWFP